MEEYCCNTCDGKFRSEEVLKKHLRTHSGKQASVRGDNGEHSVTGGASTVRERPTAAERPHACDVCGKCYTQSSHLKRHLLTHTGEKPHACDVCDKRFTQSGHLKAHLLTHTGEKPHACDVCGKSFTQLSHLKRHLLTHSDEKPIESKDRGKRSIQSSHFKTQQRSHTAEEVHRARTADNDRSNNRNSPRDPPLDPASQFTPDQMSQIIPLLLELLRHVSMLQASPEQSGGKPDATDT